MPEEQITKKGLEKLKKELEELKTEKTWEIAQWLREASAQGDLDENADYVAAKEAQTALEHRVAELEEKIRSAKVVKRKSTEIVGVGNEVHIATTSNKKTKVHLVDSTSTDAGEGKISTTSPLGEALVGKRVGDKVEVATPKGKKRYRITRIA